VRHCPRCDQLYLGDGVVQCVSCEGKLSSLRKESKMKDGICPVCDGSKTQPPGRDCQNCGGQTMYGKPTGRVPLRPDGSPCKHDYDFEDLGPCLSGYTCRHCGFKYRIDSGD
jgi:hypothetical protein